MLLYLSAISIAVILMSFWIVGWDRACSRYLTLRCYEEHRDLMHRISNHKFQRRSNTKFKERIKWGVCANAKATALLLSGLALCSHLILTNSLIYTFPFSVCYIRGRGVCFLGPNKKCDKCPTVTRLDEEYYIRCYWRSALSLHNHDIF